jgi:superfamily I DNA/RNA helicase
MLSSIAKTPLPVLKFISQPVHSNLSQPIFLYGFRRLGGATLSPLGGEMATEAVVRCFLREQRSLISITVYGASDDLIEIEGDIREEFSWIPGDDETRLLVFFDGTLSMSARKKIMGQIWRGHLQNTTISAQMFQSEVDWLEDQIPMSRTEYLSIERRGRGFRLSEELRQRVFDSLLAYQASLKSRGALDWSDVPRLLWKITERSEVKLPEFDIILIDEAQFFALLWVKLVRKALHPKNGHLFLVADPTQGFLGRGASWKSLGLGARGHTHQLRRGYRTTREIMQFATLLYGLHVPKDYDVLIPDILNMPNGAIPEILSLTSSQDEVARVANEVELLVKQGFPKKNLLLLHTDGTGVKRLILAIENRLGKGAAIDAKDTYPGDYVRVTTINAGAGLESQIVFLVGLRQLFEEEQSLRLSDEEREMLIRDNSRKLYMAATRAGQRLVLTHSGELPEVLGKALGA